MLNIKPVAFFLDLSSAKPKNDKNEKKKKEKEKETKEGKKCKKYSVDRRIIIIYNIARLETGICLME